MPDDIFRDTTSSYTDAEAYFMTMSKMVDAHCHVRAHRMAWDGYTQYYFDLSGAWVDDFYKVKNLQVGHLYDEEDFFEDVEDGAMFDGKAFGPVEALLGATVMACINHREAFDMVDVPLERLCVERPEFSPIYERMTREFGL